MDIHANTSANSLPLNTEALFCLHCACRVVFRFASIGNENGHKPASEKEPLPERNGVRDNP